MNLHTINNTNSQQKWDYKIVTGYSIQQTRTWVSLNLIHFSDHILIELIPIITDFEYKYKNTKYFKHQKIIN